MNANEIYSRLQEKFPGSITELKEEAPSDPFIVVSAVNLFEICRYLRDAEDMQFDYLECLSGMDNGETLTSVYHLYSMKLRHTIVIKTTVPKDNPVVPSVERIWRCADWHERESFDLIGINYEGHHNLIRILCPYDWEGHPLRKDYETPEYYHGMKVPY